MGPAAAPMRPGAARGPPEGGPEPRPELGGGGEMAGEGAGRRPDGAGGGARAYGGPAGATARARGRRRRRELGRVGDEELLADLQAIGVCEVVSGGDGLDGDAVLVSDVAEGLGAEDGVDDGVARRLCGFVFVRGRGGLRCLGDGGGGPRGGGAGGLGAGARERGGARRALEERAGGEGGLAFVLRGRL